ncbi:MAG: type II toxin-antitoxin system prevent-host-death family antitoxin [Patescibacteria group bacterium]
MNILPTLVSASDLQRDSARIINLARSSDQPVIIVRNNKPQAAVINIKRLQSLITKVTDWETKDALQAIKEGEEELRSGKVITLSDDLHELLDD